MTLVHLTLLHVVTPSLANSTSMRASGKKKWGAFVSRSNQALSALRMIQLVLFTFLAVALAMTLPTTTWGLGFKADGADATCEGEGAGTGEVNAEAGELTFVRVAWCYYAVVYGISLTWGLLYLQNHSVVAAPLALLKAPSVSVFRSGSRFKTPTDHTSLPPTPALRVVGTCVEPDATTRHMAWSGDADGEFTYGPLR